MLKCPQTPKNGDEVFLCKHRQNKMKPTHQLERNHQPNVC